MWGLAPTAANCPEINLKSRGCFRVALDPLGAFRSDECRPGALTGRASYHTEPGIKPAAGDFSAGGRLLPESYLPVSAAIERKWRGVVDF
jgi:hypothetical protein